MAISERIPNYTGTASLARTKVDARIETITPRDAQRYLAHNTNNRTMKRTAVRRWAAAMLRGEWMLNGEAIKFSAKGTLLDGQNRLQAVVESGVTIQALVVRGLPEETQDTMDTGLLRSGADVLYRHGFSDAASLSAAATYLFKFRTKQLRPGQAYLSPTRVEILELAQANPGLSASIGVAHRLQKRLHCSRALSAALHHWFSEIDQADADLFFESLISGENLRQGSPIFALRRWLEQTAITSKRANAYVVSASFIKAWNAFRSNEEMQVVRYRAGVEEFPVPA